MLICTGTVRLLDAKSMKDLLKVFDESFTLLKKLVAEQKLRACSMVATDLIRMSVLMDYDDGIMIGETLEGTLDQAAHLFSAFEMSKEDKGALAEMIGSNVTKLAKIYKGRDEAELFRTLRQLRSAVTRTQLEVWRTTAHKRPSERQLRELMEE